MAPKRTSPSPELLRRLVRQAAADMAFRDAVKADPAKVVSQIYRALIDEGLSPVAAQGQTAAALADVLTVAEVRRQLPFLIANDTDSPGEAS